MTEQERLAKCILVDHVQDEPDSDPENPGCAYCNGWWPCDSVELASLILGLPVPETTRLCAACIDRLATQDDGYCDACREDATESTWEKPLGDYEPEIIDRT